MIPAKFNFKVPRGYSRTFVLRLSVSQHMLMFRGNRFGYNHTGPEVDGDEKPILLNWIGESITRVRDEIAPR